MTKKGLYKLLTKPNTFGADYVKKHSKEVHYHYYNTVEEKKSKPRKKKRLIKKRSSIINKPLVSVIIPFYNVEYYLAECLNSIARQTYGLENLEVILIDDCGQDSSLEIAKSYLPFLGERSKLIEHVNNKGLGGARNSGIESANGEYIMFIDSDDFIDIETIDRLIEAVCSQGTDIAIYNMNVFSELNKKYPLNPSFELFNMFKESYFKIAREEFPKYPVLAHSFSACNKLFNKKLFTQERRFPEGQHHEDALLVMTLLLESQSISLVKDVFYQYRQRESITDKSITDKLFQSKEHFFEHLEIIKGLKELSIAYPETEYMLLWVSLRIMGSPVKSLLDGNTLLNKEEEEIFYTEVKEIFLNREIAYTYAIGSKIAQFSIDNIQIIVESKNIFEARKHYRNKNSYAQFLRSKFLKTLNTPLKDKIGYTIVKSPLKGIILIGERPTDARDNGYWLFRYIRENHPDINIFYVIKEDSKDFDKVSSLGNVVIYDSKEHIELFFASDILISTHTRGTIEPSFFDKLTVKKEYPQYYDKKYVFIQHGISISNLNNAFNKKNIVNANFAKLICGALPEFRNFEANLGYENNVITYTGFARFDSILRQKERWGSKNKIVFMPTWRADICSPSYKKEKIYNDYKFLKSSYYATILELLNCEKLNTILEKNNMEFHFIPHPEVVKYLHYFTTKYKKIKIIEPSDIDIQNELIEAKLLITDYSSVFFDFAFMKKPIIFYQFDRNDFFSKHYKKGYFDFEKHYFGEVTMNKRELLSQIRKAFYSKLTFSSNAELTHREFFLKYDENNCKRIYNEILDLM